MQINLIKYMMTLNSFKNELDGLLDRKIPEGYVEVDVKKKTKVKKSKL
jgi:hypothetical protein